MGAWMTSSEIVLGIMLFSCCACATSGGRTEARTGPSAEPGDVPPVEWTIALTGPGLERPRVFNYRQLAGMEMVHLHDVLQQKTHFPDEQTHWRGPLLQDLLDEAGLRPGSMAITLRAADGYEKTCTDEDLKSAIIALQDGEGRWLAERGRVVVVFVPPHLTGDYWIRNLTHVHCEPLRHKEPSG